MLRNVKSEKITHKSHWFISCRRLNEERNDNLQSGFYSKILGGKLIQIYMFCHKVIFLENMKVGFVLLMQVKMISMFQIFLFLRILC